MESGDQSTDSLRKDEDVGKASMKGSTEGTIMQPPSHRGQSAVGACIGWMGAKMTKFIGGPVSMHLGPWVT